tara:strand:- start:73 stop:255 length:183 start_codon:yes stop_codon:yes gene_type:complete
MIKKTILITGLSLSANLWPGAMDDVYRINTIYSSYALVAESISKCKRNNVLSMWGNAKKT